MWINSTNHKLCNEKQICCHHPFKLYSMYWSETTREPLKHHNLSNKWLNITNIVFITTFFFSFGFERDSSDSPCCSFRFCWASDGSLWINSHPLPGLLSTPCYLLSDSLSALLTNKENGGIWSRGKHLRLWQWGGNSAGQL